ncbi:MAG: wax ester/triacylglycerol synthase family O-acyltransferase [Ilumatobacteraceae bacterium]|jgi:diacylglycerol O-acyltransferase|nr:wax ester/triacylglycerol synthase family O-acyltransferase [Ilumatobacteraceae bacterium]
MQQLSGQDASFIYSERPHAPTHITSVGIYDQSTAPGGAVTFKGILAQLEDRLHLARAFRQKVVRVPGDLDHPWWIEDAEFDLEYHVRHIALPKPGDWRQFCIQTARLHARPLDLSRPLWEFYVIEGLDGVDGVPKGAFATVLKVHHAAVDGKSGVEMITAMHSQRPDEGPPPAPEVPWQAEQDPSPWQLSARAGINAMTVPGRSARLVLELVPGLGRAMRVQQRQSAAERQGRAPLTRFNGPVGPHRVIDARFFDFADLKPIRQMVPGATVNDVALAVLGGALRDYLADAGELPDEPLLAMTPVSVRAENERSALGNMVSAMVVSLATNVAEPLERLAAVHASTTSSKELTNAIGARNLTDLSQLAPGALIGLGSRLAGQFARRGMSRAVNTVVTNVPGPRQPLFFAGAELLRNFGLGPVGDGMGLINVVGSYEGQFVLSFTADREIMPDPEHYADCITGSFEELAAAS